MIAVVVPKLPVFALPVTLKAPPVVKLPPDTLPVATTNPPVPKLPTLALPVAFNVPATLTPVPVIVNIFAFPATLVVILPLAITITLLFPLTREDALAALVPPIVKEPPAGLVITTAVAFALIVALLRSIVEPERYKSLKR